MARNIAQPASRSSASDPFDRELDRFEFDRPPITMEEFIANGAGVFDSDAEVDEFIADTYAARRRDMA